MKRKTFQRIKLSLVRERAEHPYDKQIVSAAGVVTLFRSLVGNDPREHFVAIYLDSRHHVIAAHVVSVGTLNSAPVHPREVFQPAVALGAESLVVAHNHPTGDAMPSIEDRQVTERMKQAGDLMGIEVLDHVVVGESRYYSFSDESYHEAPREVAA